MRLWKILVLLAGVAGIVGFFAPLVEYRSNDGQITGDASAFQISRGVNSAPDIADKAEKLGLSSEDSQKLARVFDAGWNAYRGIVIAYFVPAALLGLIGLILLLRDSMGRFAALLALLLGAASCAAFARFWQGDQQSTDASASLGLGVYLLLASGLGGVLAGLGALVTPDRGPDYIGSR
jgi:hypothetical protein